MSLHSVMLLGATGLVGSHVLELFLADDSIERVVVLTRRPTGVIHTRLDEHVLDLATMEQHPDAFAVDAILCALGTTIRVAGSEENFRIVDHDLPLLAARLGLAGGVAHYLLVSSLGASPKSRLFYNRVKGEVETDLLALPFPRITIARPSFLIGPRKELRLGEQIITRLGGIMPARIKPIEARVVARALVTLAKREDEGARIVESRELRDIGGATLVV